VPATADSYNASGPAATGVRTVRLRPHNTCDPGIFAILPDSIGIIGLGAIGGSLAWRATQAGVKRVVGYSRSTADVIEALKRGAISEGADSPRAAARGAAFVVLATPPSATLELIDRASSWLAPGAILSDVTSIKAPVMDRARAAGLTARFAGAHPLAGTHETGFAAARPDLFRNAVVYVCSTGTLEGDGVARTVGSFWELVGESQVVTIDAAAHDVQLAWTSHLPQAVASALAVALGERALGGVSVGSGGRDTTRLAASDPDLWAEIFLANTGPVADALAQAGAAMERLRALVAARDSAGLKAFLAQGAAFRRGLER
jgi:prephenate dehydrogenase